MAYDWPEGAWSGSNLTLRSCSFAVDHRPDTTRGLHPLADAAGRPVLGPAPFTACSSASSGSRRPLARLSDVLVSCFAQASFRDRSQASQERQSAVAGRGALQAALGLVSIRAIAGMADDAHCNCLLDELPSAITKRRPSNGRPVNIARQSLFHSMWPPRPRRVDAHDEIKPHL